MTVTLVGIDCAMDEARTGLAYGKLLPSGQVEVARVTLGTAGESAVATVASWIAGQERFVLAMNAPLGWPAGLAAALLEHRAGEWIREPASRLLRRYTEQKVADDWGRVPREVAADRTARTALSALQILRRLRETCGREVPLAWVQGDSSGAIEVHPGSTLRAHGVVVSAYRGQSGKARNVRRDILNRLGERWLLRMHAEVLADNAYLLDAALCVLAAADFARGVCASPVDLALAQQEGWIWVRTDKQQGLF